MGKGHTAVTEFLKKKDRFADFFNGNLFRGQQVIRPEELETIKGEADILLEDKNQRIKGIHRYRDIVMRWKKDIFLAIYACEVQSNVHYAMPVRKMLYDSLSYLEQTENIWEGHFQGRKKNISGEEYLSRFRKDDKLIPVITIVFYYGMKEWDGSRDLYGMFCNDDFYQNEVIKQYIDNYHINLIDVGKIENIDYFQTDLNEIFGLMKYRNDKFALKNYMDEHREVFDGIDGETFRAVGAMLHTKELIEMIPKDHEKEATYNMCKAIDDIREEGREEGREAGRLEGHIEKLVSQIEKKRSKGYSIEQIADALEEEAETIESLMAERKIG